MIPDLFKERMKSLLSEKEYQEFLDSFENLEKRNPSFRINRMKVGDETKKLFGELSMKDPDTVPWEEKGFFYDEATAPGKHPYHEAGVYYIQESSAMAPVSFLDPKPYDRVLDLCAAPGGKSTQIVDRLMGKGILVTNEINRDRAKILSLNVERMGISNALVLNEDSGHLCDSFEGYFDKILVDAPCSGEGMFRKNDNAGDEWSTENVRLCANRQDEILDNAAKMLLPGGRLVYSTCTFSPEENEGSIFRFLSKHSDFHTEKVALLGGMENGRSEFLSYLGIEAPDEKKTEIERSVRLWPHRVKGEGHFLCVLRRDGNSDSKGLKKYVPGGRNVAAKKQLLKPLSDFMSETMDKDISFSLSDKGLLSLKSNDAEVLCGLVISFGDQLYLCPEDMPGINGLKVLRPGLHLGTLKKDRFEPSHALALYLKPSMTALSFDLPSKGSDIRSYLNGQTLKISSENEELKGKKGWCLITTDGFSIGWAKLSGGMLKNHYPKGLRINY